MSNKNSAADELIDLYLSRGFGTMNKNDFEVWIFNHLMKDKYSGKSDYEISIALRIPESKVKRLRYEAELKYSNAKDEERKKQLAEKIRKAHFVDTKDGQIKFSVDDRVLRSYLQNVLSKDGRFYDSSFVSNIIVLSVSDFLYLLQQLYLENWLDVVMKAKDDAKEPKELPKTFAEALGDAGKSFCRSLLEKFVGKAADDVVECIKAAYDEIPNKKISKNLTI